MAIIDKFSKEELTHIVNESHNFRELLIRIGYTPGGDNSRTVKQRIEKYGIDTSHFNSSKTVTKRTEANVFMDGSTATQKVLRSWYKKKNITPYYCSICGQQPEWMGKPLTLILDHINGTHNDNRIENLRWVCPNCNQQLETTGFHKMRVKKT